MGGIRLTQIDNIDNYFIDGINKYTHKISITSK